MAQAAKNGYIESRRLSAKRFAEGHRPPVPTLIGHGAPLPLSLGSRENNGATGEALCEQPLRRESPYHHPRGNVASLALEKLPPTCVDGRGSCGGIGEAKETDGVEGEASSEWEVAEEVRHGCKEGKRSPWTSKEVFACVYRRPRKTECKRAFDCLSAASQLAWHLDDWLSIGAGDAKGGIAGALEAAERLMAYAVSTVDRGNELWMRKLTGQCGKTHRGGKIDALDK